MRSVSIVLASSDQHLVGTVQSVAGEIAACEFQVASPFATEFNLPVQGRPTLVILHVQPHEYDQAAAWLAEVNAIDELIAVVAVSDDAPPESTLKLLRAGAADCLHRPLDLRRLAFLIDSLTLRARHRPATEVQNDVFISHLGDDDFCCASPMMEQLLSLVRRVAPQETSILLSGETGVGKTRIAKLVHQFSPRKDKPFLAVNCAALPENLIESELFGHRKGAFTGADSDRVGKFAAVGRGTLLLDEIDSLPLAVQGKLLRALDQRLFEQVGGNKTLKLEARVIVATNRDLEAESAAGRFRSDLYYRLNVVELHVPPLRNRRDAILPIAERQAVAFAQRNGRAAPRFAENVIATLQAYEWPGNIRELRNVIERAATFADAEIRLEHLPERLQAAARQRQSGTVIEGKSSESGFFRWLDRRRDSAAGSPHASELPTEGPAESRFSELSTLGRARVKAEVERLIEVLDRAGNNRSQAARELGISRVALYKKLHKYGLMDGA